MGVAPLKKPLTQSQFEGLLRKMQACSVREVERATIVIEGTLDGRPGLAAFDFMTNAGYPQALPVPGCEEPATGG